MIFTSDNVVVEHSGAGHPLAVRRGWCHESTPMLGE
jgi:hypothetical protein